MKKLLIVLVSIAIANGCSSECEDTCTAYYEETCPSKAPTNIDCTSYCDTPNEEKYCTKAFDCLNTNKRLCVTSLFESDTGDDCWDSWSKCIGIDTAQ